MDIATSAVRLVSSSVCFFVVDVVLNFGFVDFFPVFFPEADCSFLLSCKEDMCKKGKRRHEEKGMREKDCCQPEQ